MAKQVGVKRSTFNPFRFGVLVEPLERDGSQHVDRVLEGLFSATQSIQHESGSEHMGCIRFPSFYTGSVTEKPQIFTIVNVQTH
jgi:hypothetical protein